MLGLSDDIGADPAEKTVIDGDLVGWHRCQGTDLTISTGKDYERSLSRTKRPT
jgi:hypothetical protein